MFLLNVTKQIRTLIDGTTKRNETKGESIIPMKRIDRNVQVKISKHVIGSIECYAMYSFSSFYEWGCQLDYKEMKAKEKS